MKKLILALFALATSLASAQESCDVNLGADQYASEKRTLDQHLTVLDRLIHAPDLAARASAEWHQSLNKVSDAVGKMSAIIDADRRRQMQGQAENQLRFSESKQDWREFQKLMFEFKAIEQSLKALPLATIREVLQNPRKNPVVRGQRSELLDKAAQYCLLLSSMKTQSAGRSRNDSFDCYKFFFDQVTEWPIEPTARSQGFRMEVFADIFGHWAVRENDLVQDNLRRISTREGEIETARTRLEYYRSATER